MRPLVSLSAGPPSKSRRNPISRRVLQLTEQASRLATRERKAAARADRLHRRLLTCVEKIEVLLVRHRHRHATPSDQEPTR
jgi:hypothetical protein